MNDKVAVYGQRRAGVYLLSEIYNPDNVTTSVQNVGKVIPAVGSLVVDDSTTEHNTLYVVYSVDATTFKTTLVPAALAASTDLQDDQIITYGNNVYMMFFQSKQLTYETISKLFWELNVDNRICIFGTSAVSYALYRGSGIDSADKLVSNYYYEYDAYGNKVLVHSTTGRVPMKQITVPTTTAFGEPTTCQAMMPEVSYSDTAIVGNDTYTFVAYDGSGRVIAQIVLVSHEMLGLAELTSIQHPIQSFKITANQMDTEDGKCFLYRGQNVNELKFDATIIYANGDQDISMEIDNTKLFIYGVEEISTAVVNNEFTVLFKYFLGNGEASSTAYDYKVGETGRYIYTTAIVKIISPYTSKISKLAMMVRLSEDKKYSVYPVIYYNDRSTPAVCSNLDWSDIAIDGDLYVTPQAVRFRTYEQLSGDEKQSPYYQTYQITLMNPELVQDGVYWYFRDQPSSTGNFYGKNIVTYPRPFIRYVPATSSAAGYYYIPKTTFQSVEMFLNSFYFKADPPTIDQELTAKTPTHFQIRKMGFDVHGNLSSIDVATVAPIAIENYGENIAVIADLYSTGSYPNDCIVEFLYKTESQSTYEYLFGVPVDVVSYDPSTEESGSYTRDPYWFTWVKAETAEVQQIKLTYAGTQTQRGFNRSWDYVNGNEHCHLSYDKAAGKWLLTYTNTGVSKTWSYTTTDDTLEIHAMEWNNTTNWITASEVTLTLTQPSTDIVQLVTLDNANTVYGLLRSKPQIITPAEYRNDGVATGTYLRINPEYSSETTATTGHVLSYIHSSWLNLDRDFTIEFWVKNELKNQCQWLTCAYAPYVFGIGDNIGSVTGNHQLFYNYSNSYTTWYNGANGINTGAQVAVGAWAHIAITHVANSHKYIFYYNGVPYVETTISDEYASRTRNYDVPLLIGIDNLLQNAAQLTSFHDFMVSRTVRYTAQFCPHWDVTEDPDYKIIIPTTQLNEATRQEPHYKVLVGTWSGRSTATDIYLNGSVDDCFEIVTYDATTETEGDVLFTDHDPEESGSTHTYSNTKVCTVPANTAIRLYVWDTCYNVLRWQGEAYYYGKLS